MDDMETIIYISLVGTGFSVIIVVVVGCFRLKDRCIRFFRRIDEEKDDCSSDSNGLWKRPKSLGHDVRKSIDPSKSENIYSEPKDVILSIKSHQNKPLISHDVAKILKETAISVPAYEIKRNIKKDTAVSNVYDEAFQNVTKSSTDTKMNHVYAEINESDFMPICGQPKDEIQNYDLAKRASNECIQNEKNLKNGKDNSTNGEFAYDRAKPLSHEKNTSDSGNYFILENIKQATNTDYFVLEKSEKTVAPKFKEEHTKPEVNKNSYELATNIYDSTTYTSSHGNKTKRVSACPYDVSQNLIGEYDELQRVTSKKRNDQVDTGRNYGVSEIAKLFSVKEQKGPYSLAKTS